ncbi:TonB-dependent receptor [Membranicola marinus]|uniref:TonB-dependent receptor n=1 Tax=Membranihabitans marinus TaxID=1227546 RepID=A0A953HVI6_9BACT|nr:TonB-dependent receptor [Membranihabitans marinus]MBY5958956.1 TonB-dependent receptor [Membranihabitans marinus]
MKNTCFFLRIFCGTLFLAGSLSALHAQNSWTITGQVYDSLSQEPLIGVNILNRNTGQGTTTNLEGEFSIDGNPEDVLVFSYIGYATAEIPLTSENVLNVAMSADAQTLDEVVVVGYGTKKKRDLTGSVSVVDADALRKAPPSRSAEQALQGVASGVTVITSGSPGSSSKILVRGVTNFGNTQPLVIVDGIEQNLNHISPKDIESIQVLKDAGASSIYGVRGANGVILVTTKKGKTGAPVVSYDASYGIQYPFGENPFNLLMSEDYMTVYNKAFPGNAKFPGGKMPDYMYRGPGGAGVAMQGDPAVDPSLYFWESPNTGGNYIIQKLNKEGTDWYSELFKKAPNMEHNLSASGGTDHSKYLFSLGYIDQKGTMVENQLQNYSARINTEFKIGDNIRIGENLNVFHRDFQSAAPRIINGVINMEPIIPLHDIQGNWGGTFGGPELGSGDNVVAAQNRKNNDIDKSWFIVGNVFGEVELLDDFTLRSSLGYNISNSYEQSFYHTPVEGLQTNTNDNRLGVSSGFGSTMTFTNTINYKRDFGVHHIDALIGSEAIKYSGRGQNAYRTKFFSNDFNFLILGNGAGAVSNGSYISSNSLFSLFSRLDYTFDNKYLLSGTLRRDGSSRFGPNKRYGVFPSVSIGWRISQETFLQSMNWLDDLKIRASTGVLGSQNNVSAVNAFSLFGSGMTTTDYDIKGTGNSIEQGFAVNRIGNRVTGWEENVVTNAGIDLVAFSGRIDFSIDYYKKSINGLLFTEPLPAVIIGGANAPAVNIGDIQNTGIDLNAQYRSKAEAEFNYSFGVNFTSYNNKVVSIPGPGYFYAGNMGTISQTVGNAVRNEEGHPISSFYGYKVIGLFNSDEEVEKAPVQDGAAPGRFRYADIDGDGEITGNDRTHLGSPNPDFTYGVSLNMEYKNFDFSTFLYGSQGNELFNTVKAYTHFLAFYPPSNKSNDLLNAWTPENTDTNIPKIETTKSFSTTDAPSSFFVEDGSFLKIKSLMLGYTIKNSLIQNLSISNLRVYVQIADLFTFTKYTGLDPELGGATQNFGIESDSGNYPNYRSLNFGLSLSF